MQRIPLSRIVITLGLTFAMGALFAVRADDSQKPSADSPDRSARRERMHKWLLEKFDTNHNGKLDTEEREAMKKAFQERREKGGGFGRGEWRHRKPKTDDSAAKPAQQ